MLPKSMPEVDQLLRALFLVSLLLYLTPAVFRLDSFAEGRRWFQRAAILMLGTAIAIAVVASVIWFTR
jgi:ABC-type enterochelin transport system permease subunit